MRALSLIVLLAIAGCDTPATRNTPPAAASASLLLPSLSEARGGFVTKAVDAGESSGALDAPTGSEFEWIRYQSPVGPLAAYVTVDPGDGEKHPRSFGFLCVNAKGSGLFTAKEA